MEDLEQILRKIHVLFAKCKAYGDEKENMIIVPKKAVFALLEQLNLSVVAMMDEYEGTQESRERGLSEFQRKGEKLMEQAKEGADDVYAASLVYTDSMIDELQDVLAYSKESLWMEYSRMAKRLEEQKALLMTNQEEIKEQLRAMAQGGKYLHLIERENARLKHLIETGQPGKESDDYEDSDEELELEEDYEEEASDLTENADAAEHPHMAKEKKTKEAAGKKRTGKETAAGRNSTHKGKKSGGSTGGQSAGKTGRSNVRAGGRFDFDEDWSDEEKRPIRKIGTALYEEVGQSYDPPVKKVSYEVKVNEAYFEQLGEGNVDLDAEYYQWKEAQEQEEALKEQKTEDEMRKNESVSSEKTKTGKRQEKALKLKFGRKKKD